MSLSCPFLGHFAFITKSSAPTSNVEDHKVDYKKQY